MRPFENPYRHMTPIKNVIFDVIMPALSPNAWKVLCVVIRQTWGWADNSTANGRKLEDELSYDQLLEKTGIGGSATLSRAIKECLGEKYLLRREVGKSRGSKKKSFAYRLNTDFELTTSKTEVVTTSKTEAVTTSKTEHTKTTKQQTKGDGGLSKEKQDALDALRSFGVNNSEALLELAEPGAIAAWLTYAKKQGLGPGFVVKQIRAGKTPPQPKTEEGERKARRRYIEGKYADLVQH